MNLVMVSSIVKHRTDPRISRIDDVGTCVWRIEPPFYRRTPIPAGRERASPWRAGRRIATRAGRARLRPGGRPRAGELARFPMRACIMRIPAGVIPATVNPEESVNDHETAATLGGDRRHHRGNRALRARTR